MGFRDFKQPIAIGSRGEKHFSHEVDLMNINLTPGDEIVRAVFKKIFGVRSFVRWPRVLCTAETIYNNGHEDHYQSLDGVVFIGCYYIETYNYRGADIANRFFVRRVVGCNGALDTWKEDVDFPPGVKQYSVFAVYPKGYVVSPKAMRDPHNHAVTSFTMEDMAKQGIDIQRLMLEMMLPEFAVSEEDARKTT